MNLPARASEVLSRRPAAGGPALSHRELLVRVNGTALFVEERGRPGGTPIVFSHGLLMDGRMFAAQCAALADERYCVTIDHRGQGRSEELHEGGAISIEQLVEDAIAVLERLELGPVHFCGHSMGGFVGLHLAVRRPDLVRSLVLMDTTARAETLPRRLRFHGLRLAARWLGHRSVADRVLPLLLGRSILEDPERREVVAELRSALLRNRRSVWRAIKGVLDRESLDHLPPRVRVPTLIVVGNEDRATIPEKSHELHERIAGSRIVEIPRAGHSPTVEEPNAVNALLIDWLREADAQPSADTGRRSPQRPRTL